LPSKWGVHQDGFISTSTSKDYVVVYGAVNFAAKMKGTAIVEAGLASKII
jgi:hypothetical protein